MNTRVDRPHQTALEAVVPERRPGSRPAVDPVSQCATLSGQRTDQRRYPYTSGTPGRNAGEGARPAPAEQPHSSPLPRAGVSTRPSNGNAADLLEPHAAELIGHLQSWAEQLEGREAELKAREALLDLRERKARVAEQQRRQELDELEQTLAERQQLLSRRLTAAAMALGGVYQ